ncbi:MAG: imelysin family protein [Pseudomonadota bacterium]
MNQQAIHPNLIKQICRAFVTATTASFVIACGGGGGGGGGSTPVATPPPTTPPPTMTTGDDARRAVLADIGTQIILPALQSFNTDAAMLASATMSVASAPSDATATDQARTAWNSAMDSWQRNEVLQVGPSGRSSNPDAVAGGQDFREFIYSFPFTLDICALEQAAFDGSAVNGATPINITGLGALEHLLFTDAAPASCSAQPTASARASHANRLAERIAVLANSLVQRWESTDGDFIGQWSTAGLSTSVTYSTPQSALDALSIALFYVEKVTKDRKVAQPAGLPVTGLSCSQPASCPEFLESSLSTRSGTNLLINIQVFRDVFTGLNGGMGINDLLTGIDREDVATEVIAELDAAIASITSIQNGAGFDASVSAINDRNECINASANSQGLEPCAFHGVLKTAMDTFRGPVVSALSLAIPQSAAGDND